MSVTRRVNFRLYPTRQQSEKTALLATAPRLLVQRGGSES